MKLRRDSSWFMEGLNVFIWIRPCASVRCVFSIMHSLANDCLATEAYSNLLKAKKNPAGSQAAGCVNAGMTCQSYRLRRLPKMPRENSPRAEMTKLDGSGMTTSAK